MIQAKNYLLACQRYIELIAVRASMVEPPADHPWSSYRANAQGEKGCSGDAAIDWVNPPHLPPRHALAPRVASSSAEPGIRAALRSRVEGAILG